MEHNHPPPPKVEYKVLVHWDGTVHLQTEVNHYLKMGWKPLGGAIPMYDDGLPAIHGWCQTIWINRE